MSIFDQLADDLARDVLKVQDKLGDDRLYEELARMIGASSTTLEELFMTAMRVRMAERRARLYLDNHIRKAMAEKTLPKPEA